MLTPRKLCKQRLHCSTFVELALLVIRGVTMFAFGTGIVLTGVAGAGVRMRETLLAALLVLELESLRVDNWSGGNGAIFRMRVFNKSSLIMDPSGFSG